MNGAAARTLLIGGAADTRAALAGHCAQADCVFVVDGAAALEYLRGSAAAVRPRLILLEVAADAAAAVAALKAEAHIQMIPLVVLGDAAQPDACYRAGANACVVKPAAAALPDAIGALLAFWLEANEVSPAPD
jgi:CheY-like chemotaxis protein